MKRLKIEICAANISNDATHDDAVAIAKMMSAREWDCSAVRGAAQNWITQLERQTEDRAEVESAMNRLTHDMEQICQSYDFAAAE